MATAATVTRHDAGLGRDQRRNPIARTIDRWIYVFMAAWFIVITTVGFVPDDLRRQAAAQTGKGAPFTALMPFHAALMIAWLFLLLAQTTLMATGRKEFHQWLGRIAFVLVPAIVIMLAVDIPFAYRSAWHFAQSAPPAVRPKLMAHLTHDGSLLATQIREMLLFPLFIFIGLRARRTDPDLHKRMMILATAVPVLAAIARMMTWLPNGFPFAGETWLVAALMPMFVWDLFRHKRVPKAYLIWIAIYAPASVVVWVLRSSAWWDALIPHLMRV